MDKIEKLSSSPELDEALVHRAAVRADQYYWQYQQLLKSAPDAKEDIALDLTGMPTSSEYYFDCMNELAVRLILDNPSLLASVPKIKRFAEYFGAIPVTIDGKETYRRYEDRFIPVMLPEEQF